MSIFSDEFLSWWHWVLDSFCHDADSTYIPLEEKSVFTLLMSELEKQKTFFNLSNIEYSDSSGEASPKNRRIQKNDLINHSNRDRCIERPDP